MCDTPSARTADTDPDAEDTRWSTVWVVHAMQAFPLAAALLVMQVLVPTHYARATGLGLAAIGILLLVARLFDTVSDLLVGHLSDRIATRWGHRKPFVIAAAPLVGVAVWMLFNPPADAGAAYLLTYAFLLYVAGTFMVVPLNAWGAELAVGYRARSRLSGLRVAFALSGTLVVLALTAAMQQVDADGLPVLDSVLVYSTWLVLATLLVTSVLAALRVPDTGRVHHRQGSLAGALRLIMAPSPARLLLLAYGLNAMANAIPATLFLLYVTHVLAVPEQAGILLFGYFLCAALATPAWVMLANRYGKHRVWCAAMLIACVFFSVTPFLDASGASLFMAVVVVTGLAAGADLALPAAINADMVDWDEAVNGQRRAGLFFALWGTVSKLSYAMAVGLAFPLLQGFGFDANASNAASATRALAWLYGAPCIAFKLLAIGLMWRFPITEAVHRRHRSMIRARLAASGTPPVSGTGR